MRSFFPRFAPALAFLLPPAFCSHAHAQSRSDVALSAYGTFSKSTTPENSNFQQLRITESAGGLFEYRYIRNGLLGFEGTYSYNRANEVFRYTGPTPIGFMCQGPNCINTLSPYSANGHEFTLDYVPSVRLGDFRIFALAGVGAVLTRPVGSQPGTANANNVATVYGAGFDWNFGQHLSLRTQFRGNVYRPPNIIPGNSNANIGHINTVEPAIGLSYRF